MNETIKEFLNAEIPCTLYTNEYSYSDILEFIDETISEKNIVILNTGDLSDTTYIKY